MNEMNLLLAILLQARNVAHTLHWKTKSFAQHVALGELYDKLTSFTDELAEMYMGISGEQVDVDVDLRSTFDKSDPVAFIQHLTFTLNDYQQNIPQAGELVNKYEELKGMVATIKYKLEQLH